MSNACSIPKTIVYINQKKLAPKVVTILRTLLPPDMQVRPPRPKVWNSDPRPPSEVFNSAYHGNISETWLNKIGKLEGHVL